MSCNNKRKKMSKIRNKTIIKYNALYLPTIPYHIIQQYYTAFDSFELNSKHEHLHRKKNTFLPESALKRNPPNNLPLKVRQIPGMSDALLK